MIRSVAVACVKAIRPYPREDLKRGVRWMAARRFPRQMLNFYYSGLSYERKAAFHEEFSELFDGYNGRFDDGVWEVVFRGTRIKLPLRKEKAWLDWNLAVSVLGHDAEIKQSYEALLSLPQPPKVVLDVGTNFGTHSILFLASGMRTVSFEPNPNCHAYLKKICEWNQVECQIEQIALGDREGAVELCFPQDREWNGTVLASQKDGLESDEVMVRIDIRQTTMDDYVERHMLRPDLIKVDTEGAELLVLRGARQTLTKFRPLVVFEALPEAERAQLFSSFSDLGYGVCRLPVSARESPVEMSPLEFQHSKSNNFIAVPAEELRSWPPQFAN